ncbi:MAG: N-acetylmuramoyl-L-alanine amidase, partial [Nitrospirota bacterium]
PKADGSIPEESVRILTEVGFISNPEEEALLATPQYRQKIAQAIFDGVKEYISTAKVASSKPAQ